MPTTFRDLELQCDVFGTDIYLSNAAFYITIKVEGEKVGEVTYSLNENDSRSEEEIARYNALLTAVVTARNTIGLRSLLAFPAILPLNCLPVIQGWFENMKGVVASHLIRTIAPNVNDITYCQFPLVVPENAKVDMNRLKEEASFHFTRAPSTSVTEYVARLLFIKRSAYTSLPSDESRILATLEIFPPLVMSLKSASHLLHILSPTLFNNDSMLRNAIEKCTITAKFGSDLEKLTKCWVDSSDGSSHSKPQGLFPSGSNESTSSNGIMHRETVALTTTYNGSQSLTVTLPIDNTYSLLSTDAATDSNGEIDGVAGKIFFFFSVLLWYDRYTNQLPLLRIVPWQSYQHSLLRTWIFYQMP
jgi:hypothetical protein